MKFGVVSGPSIAQFSGSINFQQFCIYKLLIMLVSHSSTHILSQLSYVTNFDKPKVVEKRMPQFSYMTNFHKPEVVDGESIIVYHVKMCGTTT